MRQARSIVALFAGCAAAVAGAAQAAEPLNLVCTGHGEAMASEYVRSLEWDRYDHKYRPKEGLESKMRGFESAVTLQIDGDDGRIRLPEKLIPPLNSGGDHQHWWQLENLILSEAEIKASYRLNGLNKPKLRIDRNSGEISIKGTGQDFSGICQKIDAGQRRF